MSFSQDIPLDFLGTNRNEMESMRICCKEFLQELTVFFFNSEGKSQIFFYRPTETHVTSRYIGAFYNF